MTVRARRTKLKRAGPLMGVCALAATACTPATHGPVSPAWLPSPEAMAVMDSIARAPVDAGDVAGISVGIASGGRISHTVSHGVASLETGVPATDCTVYRIGSIAKQMTAAAILRLEQEGRLSVADPILLHLPDLPAQWAGVTIDHRDRHHRGSASLTGGLAGAGGRRDPFGRDLGRAVPACRAAPCPGPG
jgi:CubicO group peptidase (beta-lactamase class C family)